MGLVSTIRQPAVLGGVPSGPDRVSTADSVPRRESTVDGASSSHTDPAAPARSSPPSAPDSGGGSESERATQSDPGLVWPLVVAVCTAGWILLFAAMEPLESVVPEWVLGLVMVVFWVGFPIGIYLDARRTRAVSQWPRFPKTVALLSAVWFLNVVVGCWYLAKRYRVSPGSPERNGVHGGDRTGRPVDSRPTTGGDPWPDPRDRGDTDLEGRLAALNGPAFAQFVADLRSAWGWNCTILEAEPDRGPGIDVVAIDDADSTCTLIRTVHCEPDGPVPLSEIPDAETIADRVTPPADSVLVATNGRFDGDSQWLTGDYTLLDRGDLLELLEAADVDADSLLPDEAEPWEGTRGESTVSRH